MKRTALKITLISLSIIFFIVLVGFILFFNLNFSNQNILKKLTTVDKYSELKDFCEITKIGKTIQIKCDALLAPLSEDEKKLDISCYNMHIISVIDNKLQNFAICENKNTVTNTILTEAINNKALIPTKVRISYIGTNNPFHYVYDTTEFRQVENKDYFERFYNHQDIRNIDHFVYMNGVTIHTYRGFLLEDITIFEDVKLHSVKFIDVKLKSKSSKGNLMELAFEGKFHENHPYTIKTSTNGFTLINLEEEAKDEERFEYIKDINDPRLIIGNRYTIAVSYFIDNHNKVLEECGSNKKELSLQVFAICNNLSLLKDSVITKGFTEDDVEELLNNAEGKDIEINNSALNYGYIYE